MSRIAGALLWDAATGEQALASAVHAFDASIAMPTLVDFSWLKEPRSHAICWRKTSGLGLSTDLLRLKIYRT